MNFSYKKAGDDVSLEINGASSGQEVLAIIDATISCDQQHQIDRLAATVKNFTVRLRVSNTALQGVINQQEN